MNMSEKKSDAKDRIKQTMRIPVDYAEIKVDAPKEEISKLITRLILDEQFRVQFNKNPGKILRDIGIYLDEEMIKKMEGSPITTMLRDMSPTPIPLGAGAVVVVVVILVFVPSPTD